MANFDFVNLTQEVREFMVSEINDDIVNSKLYISDRLNEEGKKHIPNYF